MNRSTLKIQRRQVGIYSVGALSMSFFSRLRADLLIGRKNSATSAWVQSRGAIKIDGRLRNIRSVWRRGLACLPLPEIILVCPNADQLDDFLDELLEHFRLLDEASGLKLDDIPKFLIASSGLYMNGLRREALRRVKSGKLMKKDLFIQALDRRLFRAVAYQTGIRRGRGKNAEYVVGRENNLLILERTGTASDRDRICALLSRRGCPIHVERRRQSSEYDKALVNLLFCTLTQFYAVNDRKLIDVRFGDLLADSRFLPRGFEPRPLRHRPLRVRRQIEKVGCAFIDIAIANGIYPSKTALGEKFARLERLVLSNYFHHRSSSFQMFKEKLMADPLWTGKELLPTQKTILEPLIRGGMRLGRTSAARTLADFKNELLASYQRAIEIRNAWKARLALAEHLIERKNRRAQAFMIGISGLPGIGKTTLARSLADILEFLNGGQVVCLSIDDFYHPVRELRERGIKQWGIGAHDLRFAEILQELKNPSSNARVELPTFDKAARDRGVPRSIAGKADFVLFEGFGVGLRSRGYDAFSRHLDCLIALRAGPAACRRWRKEAGWLDQRAIYRGDRKGYEADFTRLWAMVSAQADLVLPEVESLADLVIPVGKNHSLLAAALSR